jgi:acyl-CoA thioesterase-2
MVWHDSRVTSSPDRDLTASVLASLDDLLAVLRLEAVAEDRFRIPSAATELFDRVYGGQLLAQALVAASATVVAKEVHSLHAAFVNVGQVGRPVEVAVTRVRDGRSMAARGVTVLQEGDPLLVAFASFHANTESPDWHTSPPVVPAPEETPILQHWAAQAADVGRHWVDRPPPIELRLPEPPSFLGGTGTGATRSHWMRLPRPVGDDPTLHAALLAYASDFFLMDMVFRVNAAELGPTSAAGYSVDHAIWFHRPTSFDGWHLHTQEAITLVGQRGLARGSIHDQAGRLVATVMQEVLVRSRGAR